MKKYYWKPRDRAFMRGEHPTVIEVYFLSTTLRMPEELMGLGGGENIIDVEVYWEGGKAVRRIAIEELVRLFKPCEEIEVLPFFL